MTLVGFYFIETFLMILIFGINFDLIRIRQKCIKITPSRYPFETLLRLYLNNFFMMRHRNCRMTLLSLALPLHIHFLGSLNYELNCASQTCKCQNFSQFLPFNLVASHINITESRHFIINSIEHPI